MKKLLFFATCALIINACHQKQETAAKEVQEPQPKVYNSLQIRALYHQADSLLNIGKADTVLMNQYVNLATQHVQTQPDDTLAADFLFYAGIFELKVAALTPPSETQNRFAFRAIDIFNQVIEKYPDYVNLDYCYYYKGNIYENLKRYSDAENEYRELVHRFPQSDLAQGIAAYLEVQGFSKTPDQMMQDIKVK